MTLEKKKKLLKRDLKKKKIHLDDKWYFRQQWTGQVSIHCLLCSFVHCFQERLLSPFSWRTWRSAVISAPCPARRRPSGGPGASGPGASARRSAWKVRTSVVITGWSFKACVYSAGTQQLYISAAHQLISAQSKTSVNKLPSFFIYVYISYMDDILF